MKEYKLLKWYPGLPVLLTKVNYILKINPIDKDRAEVIMPNKIFFHINLADLKYEEFWEEIKSNYILVKVISKTGIIENGNNCLSTLQELITGPHSVWRIYSVKRISDGVIFSLGDDVYENTNSEKYKWIITEFSLDGGKCFSCGLNIDNIMHKQIPLYKTELGFEIFSGDTVWRVNKNMGSFFIDSIVLETILDINNYEYVYFTKIQDAKDYVIDNKICLSYKDIKLWNNGRHEFPFTVLKKIVMDKINKTK